MFGPTLICSLIADKIGGVSSDDRLLPPDDTLSLSPDRCAL